MGRRSQVVRQRSAKPSSAGSIPAVASKSCYPDPVMRNVVLALILGAGVVSTATAEPPPPILHVTGISPTIARPSGGEVVTISGGNFANPVRVLFDQKE